MTWSRALALALALVAAVGCARRPEVQPPPSVHVVADALRLAAVVIESPVRAGDVSPDVCAAATVSAAVLVATADALVADVPEVPALSVELGPCRLSPVQPDRLPPTEPVVALVDAAFSTAQLGLVVARIPERDPRGYAVALATFQLARSLIPQVLATLATPDLPIIIPARPLSPAWGTPAEE